MERTGPFAEVTTVTSDSRKALGELVMVTEMSFTLYFRVTWVYCVRDTVRQWCVRGDKSEGRGQSSGSREHNRC